MWYADFAPVSDEQVLALLAEAREPASEELALKLADIELPGRLILPVSPRGTVVFAHGSGSSRDSPRNMAVAGTPAARGPAPPPFGLLPEREARRARARLCHPPLPA